MRKKLKLEREGRLQLEQRCNREHEGKRRDEYDEGGMVSVQVL